MLRDLQWLRDRNATRDESPSTSFASNSDAPVRGGRKRSYAHGDSLVDGCESSGQLVLPTLPASSQDPGDQRLGLSPVADEPDPLDAFGSLEGEQNLRHKWSIVERSASIAETISGSVDLIDVRSLLDISGQAGVLSSALCERNPRLVTTVFDPPDDMQRNPESFVSIQRPEADSRVTFVHSSSHAVWYDALSINHDAVLMQHGSGTSPAVTMQTLYGRAFQGLRPRGLLLVHGVVADGEETTASTEMAEPELAQVSIASTAMVAAGFGDIRQIDLGESSGHLLVGRKEAPQ